MMTAVMMAAVSSARAAEPAGVVSVEVKNVSARRLADVPVSFGQAFKQGDVPRGQHVLCFAGRQLAQVDVKRTYDDGSLRFAVISAVLRELPPGGSRTLNLAAGSPLPSPPLKPVMLEDLLKSDFNAAVTLRFPDGTSRSVDARKLLARATEAAATWLQGHVATEWIVAAPPVDADGNPDEDLNVQLAIRAYAGCKRVRVSVTVENCFDTWPGNIRYDAAVIVDGKQVFSQKAVDHRRLSRWRKVFWCGGDGPAVHVTHDLGYLISTCALPNYDRTLPPPDRPDPHAAMEGPRFEIMGQGSLCAYMPTTGGRPEIGSYPTWAVRYLLGMQPAEKALVLANGDLAGSWPIHVRSRNTGRIMTIDQRPKFWLDQRGDDKPQWKPDRHATGPNYVKLSPDLAHQGSFAYIPYLVTGDHYYLEEAYFWANFCLLASWNHLRHDAEGILCGQVRGNAWSLRNMADAAWIAPDGDPERAYFEQKVRNNLADRTRRMLGPPEYNKLGFWGERTTDSARIPNPPNPRWMITAPWEHDYLMWSLNHLVELGYPEAARPRDFLLRWRVGTVTNAPDFDPRLVAPYRMVVGEKNDAGEVVFYDDWKQLCAENLRLNKPDFPSGSNDYAYSARAAIVCGVDGGFPKAADALRWLEANFPNLRGTMARNPVWAILPRKAIAPRP